MQGDPVSRAHGLNRLWKHARGSYGQGYRAIMPMNKSRCVGLDSKRRLALSVD